ncbi:MAG: hypothetical protein LBD24_08990 [Spirochaetaceae bacterium]|nr:hypothetical protein [Spirochaetaceae bacterium]
MHSYESTSGHVVPPAAGGVLHRSETTGGHAETAGGCAKRSRASTVNSEVNGQGVAPFGNNRRPY